MLKQIQRLPFAPVVALMFAAVAAILVLATPVWLLEHAVVSLGLPDIVSPAAPPLGTKARLLLAILAAGGAGMLAFLIALPFRDAKPRKAHSVTVQPLRRAETGAAMFNRPSVFAPPPMDEEPNLPSFLAGLPPLAGDDSLPVAENDPAEQDGDELLLDALMIVEDAEPVMVLEEAFVAVELPQMPDIFTPAETVLHLEPAPVPPPLDPVIAAPAEDIADMLLETPRPRIVEHREPTIAELMERFQRGLETLKRSDASPFDDPVLRHALTQLERIAVGGR